MTKSELIKAMKDFPDDMQLKVRGKHDDIDVEYVDEICPTQTDTSENYLLIS